MISVLLLPGAAVADNPLAKVRSYFEEAVAKEQTALEQLNSAFHDLKPHRGMEQAAKEVIELLGPTGAQFGLVFALHSDHVYLNDVQWLPAAEQPSATSGAQYIERQESIAYHLDRTSSRISLESDVAAYLQSPQTQDRKAAVRHDVTEIRNNLEHALEAKRKALSEARSLPPIEIDTYRYEITIAGSGSVTSFSPAPAYGLDYTGAVSGTFSVTYRVAITVNHAARTVAMHSLNQINATPNPITSPTLLVNSFSVGGTSSFSVTASCASGSSCTGPPTTCAFSSGNISPYYRSTAGRLEMPGVGTVDHTVFATGKLWLEQIVNGPLPNPPKPTPCTGGPGGNGGGQAYSPADPTDIPGFTDGSPYGNPANNQEFSPIALSELGRAQFKHSFNPTGTCGIDFSAVSQPCQAAVSITFKLLG